MKGDFTRLTHLPAKHYNRVLKQQGRVDLDSDWNEAAEIQAWRQSTQGVDVIGACGTPKIGGGFQVSNVTTDGTDFSLSTGRIYVGGLLCQLDDPGKATYLNQPDLPGPQALQPVDQQVDLVYLYVWERHITAQRDPDLLEVALGGPDTTTRVKTICQVRVEPNVGPGSCAAFENWGLPESDGRLTVETGETEAAEPDACAITPLEGYTGLENRLYRVEIHTGSEGGAPTFKWSRDNGSAVFAVEEFFNAEPKKVRLKSLGHDQILELALGDWVEISDDASELEGHPGTFAQISDLDVANRILTLSEDLSGYSLDFHPSARRWDQDSAPIPVSAGPIPLEAGIQVRFSGTTYKTGDYWTFPARTATGDIQRLTEAPSQGIRYYTCVLALIRWRQNGENWEADIEDCRPVFPALANLAAEDVSFDNTSCQLPGAGTVQEALDQLCASRDLRHHNKHLHGWGIVCGLQVNCGPDEAEETRRNVTVRDGYAIDCNGNDLLIAEDIAIDVLDRIAELDAADPDHPVLDQNGDGEVCLSLDLDEALQIQIGVERYQPDNDFQSLLSGTLLMDLYNDCLKAPAEAIRALVTPQPGEENLPVGPTEKRLRTILNLVIQTSDPAHGSTVFLSPKEDQILRDLYAVVRGLLQSQTFCAMFDNARQFPDYPFPDHRITTVFGKGQHTRLRLHPTRPLAYTLGQGANLHVFDLEKEEMLAVIPVPGGAGIQVEDIAFSQDGNTLYAIATLNQNDTVFATARIDGEKLDWQPVTVLCDVKLVTLATAFKLAREQVYAIGEQKGLYLLNPNNLPTDPQPIAAFPAVGHLEINEELKRGYATASSQATKTYDQVYELDLSQAKPPFKIITLATPDGKPLTGQTGTAFIDAKNNFVLGAVVDLPTTPATKGVWLYNAIEGVSKTVVPIENAALSLGAIRRSPFLLVADHTNNWVQMINVASQELVPEFRLPVQITPVAIASQEKNDRIVVLNSTSGTLSLVPKGYFQGKSGNIKPTPGGQEFLDALVDYRVGVLEAYADLTGAALQYVKDCLFDHFLVNCPECEPDPKIYLACVSVRGNQVFKVCNYSKRKYVKSFPLVGYWFSLVPVMPLIDKAIEQIACQVLPELFGQYKAPRPAADQRTVVSGEMVGQGLAYLATNNLRQKLQLKAGQITAGRGLAFDAIKNTMVRQVRPGQVVAQSDLVDRPVDEAREKMEAAQVNVARVEAYNPALGLSNVVRFTQAPPVIQPGERVTLYEENGVVRYYTVEKEGVQTLRDEVEAQKGALVEVEDLKASVSNLQTALTARDQELEALRSQVKSLEARPTADIETELQELRKFREEVTQFMAKSSRTKSPGKPKPPAKPEE